MSKYSLAIIARNCASDLDRLLTNYGRFPDEVVVVNTGIDENEEGFTETSLAASRHGAKVFHFPWVDDFSAARNFSFSQCSHDMVMWLDTDDIVHNAEAVDTDIRAIIEKGYDLIYVDYLYEWEGEPLKSQCTCTLTRERVVNRHVFEWRAPIHECLCANFAPRGIRLDPNTGAVVHHALHGDKGRKEEHLLRNLRHLEKNFPDGKCELRMRFYWANTLMGLKRYPEAAAMYESYITEANNKHERIIARNAVSECYRMMKEFGLALDWAYSSIVEDERLPTGWLHLAEASHAKGDWQEAARFADSAMARAANGELEMVTNERGTRARPLFIKAHSLLRMKKFAECQAILPEAARANAVDKDTSAVLEEMQNTLDRSRLVGGAELVLKQVAEERGIQDAAELAALMPEEVMKSPVPHRFMLKNRPSGKPSIAFFCGNGTHEEWGPESIASGIGGSEEAVINMASEFDKRGWHVEVYRRGPRLTHGTQEWYPAEQWTGDNDSDLDVLVWWRSPEMIHPAKNALSRWIWLHDIQDQSRWNIRAADWIDGAFALSPYHADMVSFLGEKAIVSGNGTDPELWSDPGLFRKPRRLIYASCPTRGLANILQVWPAIREKHPDAELDVFYGWSPTFKAMAKNNQMLQSIYEAVEGMRNQDGVNWHGKVGQKELNDAFARAGIWAYPTEFPEISCITAMKAQIHGAIPVCTDDFALRTTVQHGIKVPGPMSDTERLNEWTVKLIELMGDEALQDQIRKSMVPWARKEYTWKRIADQWESLFARMGACPRKSSEAVHSMA